MADSSESRVLLDHTRALELALKDNIDLILEDLNRVGLLKSDVYSNVKDVNSRLSAIQKASSIVTSIREVVQIQPNNYHKFIKILKRNERHYYDIIKTLEQARCVEQDSEEPGVKSKDLQELTNLRKRYPFLKLGAGEDKEKLMRRLEIESEEIGEKFTTLVAHTEVALREQGITVQGLILVIKNRPSNKDESKNNLIKRLRNLENNTNITEAFIEISDYWSFFNYELLGTFIKSYEKNNQELNVELNEYVDQFTHYCKRRLCEVPIDPKEMKEARSQNVKIKLDTIFNVPAETVKRTIEKLSLILDTSFRLVDVERGCVELIFICMHELDAIFPISAEQRQNISEVKMIMKIYSDTGVYYERDFDTSFVMTNYVQSVVLQGRLYVGGGVAGIGIGSSDNFIVREYDISLRIWCHPLPSYTTQYFAMTAVKNQLVLVGGAKQVLDKASYESKASNGSKASNVLGAWDTAQKTWTHPYPDMLEPRSGCSAIVYNEWLVVAGGWAGGRPLSSVEVLDTEENRRWYAGPQIPIPWYCMKTALVRDTGYFMGGTDKSGSSYTTNVYQVCIKLLISRALSPNSVEKDRPLWKVMPELHLSGTSPLSSNGSLLVVGGLDEDCYSSTNIQLYRSDTEEWVNVGHLQSPRYNCSCAMITDSDVLVILGEENICKQLPNMELAQIKISSHHFFN